MEIYFDENAIKLFSRFFQIGKYNLYGSKKRNHGQKKTECFEMRTLNVRDEKK